MARGPRGGTWQQLGDFGKGSRLVPAAPEQQGEETPHCVTFDTFSTVYHVRTAYEEASSLA
jgi:hypothetical protein